MSVYGGDSWAREAHSRKRRIDLLFSDQLHKSHSQKLANGKYACLVCPNRPILDTLPMLTMHNQGARHQGAASKLKEREIRQQEEISKRIALSEPSDTNSDASNDPLHCSGSLKCPLLEKTRRGTADIFATGKSALAKRGTSKGDRYFDTEKKPFFSSLHAENVKAHDQEREPAVWHPQASTGGDSGVTTFVQSNYKVVSNVDRELQLDLQKQRERELKLRAAGWRRDGRGGWFREENVEFDSDEEDPNATLGTSCQ